MDAMARKKSSVRIESKAAGKHKVNLSAYAGDKLVHADIIDLRTDSAREKFAKAVERKSACDGGQVREQLLDQLRQLTDTPTVAVPSPQYRAVRDCDNLGPCGIYRVAGQVERISNFVVQFERDIEVVDELDCERRFEGTIELEGICSPISITASDFASDTQLRAVIFACGGAKAQILTKPEELRVAISAISQPTKQRITTRHGWNDSLDAYLFPGGKITATGLQEELQDGERVELGHEEKAQHLRLLRPDDTLRQLKRHIVEDLLFLHDAKATHSVLASVGLAVLMRFLGNDRPVIWLTGLTGAGKSLVARLAMSFFGDFPVSSERFVTWTSTSNFIERQGHFFGDSLFLVDDFKPEVCRVEDAVRIIQAYADRGSRGRLNANSSIKKSYPIRGLLLATGEDIPTHAASAVARSIIINVRQQEKDLVRGHRCIERCARYAQFTADFIHQFLSGQRRAVLQQDFERLQREYYTAMAGQQNDARIAKNLAMLGAAFGQIGWYLSDVWSEAEQAVREYQNEVLVEIGRQMLGTAHEQQVSEIFRGELWDLLTYGHVRLQGWVPANFTDGELTNKSVIGRTLASDDEGERRTAEEQLHQIVEISTSLALRAVNESLSRKGRSVIAATERTLLNQLTHEGLLLDEDGQVLDARQGGRRTQTVRLGDGRSRVFRIHLDRLNPEWTADGYRGAAQN
jgi:PAS domain-containing protein